MASEVANPLRILSKRNKGILDDGANIVQNKHSYSELKYLHISQPWRPGALLWLGERPDTR